jgi:hypothetical protein
MDGMENDVKNSESIDERISIYNAITGIQRDINKVQDMLLKMEDRMFLNPAARIKSIPKKEKEKPKNMMEEEFDI